MRKKLISFLLVVCLLASCCTAFAADAAVNQKADALNLLGLFQGTDKGYELDKLLTREQGLAMLLRLMGQEKEALATTETCIFSDVYDWAKPYVAYAYAKNITKGVSETQFGYGKELSDAMFLTMLLRALGYEDGEGKDFVWDQPYELAAKLGLISEAVADTSFSRGDMVVVAWNMLQIASPKLVEAGLVTAEILEAAKQVAEGTLTLADAKKALGIVDPAPAADGDDENGQGSEQSGGVIVPSIGGTGTSTFTPPAPSIGGNTQPEKQTIPLKEARHETPDMDL